MTDAVNVRIFGSPQDGQYPMIKSFVSTHVPRIGEHWCIEYWSAEIYRVEWTLLGGGLCADVFCETSEIDRKRSEASNARAT